MQGVSTHLSNSKSNTSWTTVLKKNPDTLGSDPSRPSILVIQAQLFLGFLKLNTTAGQFFYPSFMTRLRYLNKLTVSNGFP